MSTKAYKVTVLVTTPNGTIAADNISITHSINDIPVASISVVPQTEKEIKIFSNLEQNLFKDFSISVGMGKSSNLVLTGQFVGLETTASTTSAREIINIRGGLYKLATMGTWMPGLHILGEHSTFRLSLNSNTLKTLLLINQSQAKTKKNIIEVFQETLDRLFLAISQATPAKTSSTNSFYGSMGKALKALYKFHATQGQSALKAEFKKIKVASGLDSTSYYAYTPESVHQITANICSSSGSTFWNILMALCELYQIHLGTYADKVFAVPANQVGEPSIEIPPEDIVSISISPFPIYSPTRCIFTASGNVTQAYKGLPSIGMFPPIDKANKPTQFEEKMGAVRPIAYSKPGFALHRQGVAAPVQTNINSNIIQMGTIQQRGGGITDIAFLLIQQTIKDIKESIAAKQALMKRYRDEDNMFAQTYLAKETFKHRTGSLNLRYSPNIPVGLVVKFSDPIYKKSYQGYVTRVTQDISSSAIGTTVIMQYVIGDKEREFLGLDTGGYMDNLLYPNYKAGDLIKMLGIS